MIHWSVVNLFTKNYNIRKLGKPVDWYPNAYKTETLGWIYTIHPNNPESFFLRILLHNLRGPTSFEYLRSVDGIVYETYRQGGMQTTWFARSFFVRIKWNKTIKSNKITLHSHYDTVCFIKFTIIEKNIRLVLVKIYLIKNKNWMNTYAKFQLNRTGNSRDLEFEKLQHFILIIIWKIMIF